MARESLGRESEESSFTRTERHPTGRREPVFDISLRTRRNERNNFVDLLGFEYEYEYRLVPEYEYDSRSG